MTLAALSLFLTQAAVEPPVWRAALDLVVAESTGVPLEMFRAMAVDGNGSMYIPQNDHVLAIRADGRIAGRFGRPGRGPGEFSRVAMLGLLGDTLWVSDIGLRRVSFYKTDGAYIRDVVLGFQPPEDDLVFAFAEGVVRGGGLLLVQRSLSRSRPPDFKVQGRFVLFDAETGSVRTLGHHTIRPGSVVIEGDQQRIAISQPFVDGDLVYASQGGDAVLVVRRTAPDTRRGVVHFTLIAANGDTVRTHALVYNAPELDEAFERKYLSSTIQRIRTRAAETGMSAEQALERLYRPRFVPLVDAAFHDVSGNVWLRLITPSTTLTRWWILDLDQGVIGQLDMPPNFRALWANDIHVWGTFLVETGEPRLHRYTLVRHE